VNRKRSARPRRRRQWPDQWRAEVNQLEAMVLQLSLAGPMRWRAQPSGEPMGSAAHLAAGL
jgi:hypothetical protein